MVDTCGEHDGCEGVEGLVYRCALRGEDRRIVRLQTTASGAEALQKLQLTDLPLPVKR
jgi:hypothetical protein